MASEWISEDWSVCSPRRSQPGEATASILLVILLVAGLTCWGSLTVQRIRSYRTHASSVDRVLTTPTDRQTRYDQLLEETEPICFSEVENEFVSLSGRTK